MDEVFVIIHNVLGRQDVIGVALTEEKSLALVNNNPGVITRQKVKVYESIDERSDG